jgi:hypothetical protein
MINKKVQNILVVVGKSVHIFYFPCSIGSMVGVYADEKGPGIRKKHGLMTGMLSRQRMTSFRF